MQGYLPTHRASGGFRRIQHPFVIDPRAGAGAAEVIKANRALQRAGERGSLHRQTAAVKLHFGAAFGPEHAVAGQQMAILRLDMDIDLKGVFARLNGDDLPDSKFTVQHHGAGLHVRQRLG